jgi:hypothetical protein
MPQTRDIALEQLTAAGDALPVAETRVDAAHTLGDALVSLPPLAEMPVAEAIADLVRVEGAVQLQSQAEQLAAHLRQRQQELDRREAELNARLADFENEVRDARLWLAQRDEELSEREKGSRVQGSGFRVHGPGPGNHEADGGEPSPVGSILCGVSSSAGSALCGVPAGCSSTGTGEAELDTNTSDSVVNAPRISLGEGRGGDGGHGARLQDYGAAWRQLRGSLSRQSEELDRRRAALEKFQEKVSQMHQEALQLRLAAEEAQADLRTSLGVDRADEVIALGRERLARHFQGDLAELTRNRRELESLKNDLATEHQRLERRYREFKELIR